MPENNKSLQRKLIDKDIHFSVRNIELLESSINIPDNFPEIDTLKGFHEQGFAFKFGCKIRVSISREAALIGIDYEFLKDGTPLLSMRVKNEFHILNLARLAGLKNESSLKDLCVYLAEVSIFHARGIQSTIVKGTPISNLYIPPISRNTIEATTLQHMPKAPDDFEDLFDEQTQIP